MKMILVVTFAASLWGSDVRVQISSDSEQSAEALLQKLNEQGQGRDLRFVRTTAEMTADFKLVVNSIGGGPTLREPIAQVQVYAKDNTPLYTVGRRGFLTRGNALNRCAGVIVKDFTRRMP